MASAPYVPRSAYEESATGHELSTPLGTIVGWRSGGVSFVLAGSVTAATAAADAAAVQ